MSTPIDTLRTMSPQARAALKRAGGFAFLEEAAAMSDQDLLAIPGFGDSSLQLLRTWARDPAAAMIRKSEAAPVAGRMLKLAEEVRQIEVEAARLRAAGKESA